MLCSVPPSTLSGREGVRQLRELQGDMAGALARRDFARVRQLDQTAAVVVDKLIEANGDDRQLLRDAMLDLKSVYADMIAQCRRYDAVAT